LSLLIDYGYLRELQTDGEGRRTVKHFFHSSLESEVKNEVENRLKTVLTETAKTEKTKNVWKKH
jgi:hypothetical protein